MNELMSAAQFKWFLTILTGGLAGSWLVYDFVNLIRIRNADLKDPLVRDKIFGYIMGMTVGIVGVLGCLKFHDVV